MNEIQNWVFTNPNRNFTRGALHLNSKTTAEIVNSLHALWINGLTRDSIIATSWKGTIVTLSPSGEINIKFA
jgi:hypothetical protein